MHLKEKICKHNTQLELEFKHHNQIKTKFLKWIVKNILPNYKS